MQRVGRRCAADIAAQAIAAVNAAQVVSALERRDRRRLTAVVGNAPLPPSAFAPTCRAKPAPRGRRVAAPAAPIHARSTNEPPAPRMRGTHCVRGGEAIRRAREARAAVDGHRPRRAPIPLDPHVA
ncbi:hypothetical protein BpKM390_20070 [Burkholderia pseudomallei]|nr:hypothetical protein GTC050_19440 [Burkholderia pseudomallei]BEH30258.1 hypothetical protein GTC054_14740 [Burkholderia pseudomallei]BEH42743.1 hypothetical protein KNG_19440 [Burkholderia pseudomallei]BEH48641.1 hypothetical protein TKS_18730 [Burkholderia pseudomallei]BEH60762.1 hypothetical protein BpKM390_20070 [Burkholderia pseudomallei]